MFQVYGTGDQVSRPQVAFLSAPVRWAHVCGVHDGRIATLYADGGAWDVRGVNGLLRAGAPKLVVGGRNAPGGGVEGRLDGAIDDGRYPHWDYEFQTRDVLASLYRATGCNWRPRPAGCWRPRPALSAMSSSTPPGPSDALGRRTHAAHRVALPGRLDLHHRLGVEADRPVLVRVTPGAAPMPFCRPVIEQRVDGGADGVCVVEQ